MLLWGGKILLSLISIVSGGSCSYWCVLSWLMYWWLAVLLCIILAVIDESFTWNSPGHHILASLNHLPSHCYCVVLSSPAKFNKIFFLLLCCYFQTSIAGSPCPLLVGSISNNFDLFLFVNPTSWNELKGEIFKFEFI